MLYYNVPYTSRCSGQDFMLKYKLNFMLHLLHRKYTQNVEDEKFFETVLIN